MPLKENQVKRKVAIQNIRNYRKTRGFQSIQSKMGKIEIGKTATNQGKSCFYGISA